MDLSAKPWPNGELRRPRGADNSPDMQRASVGLIAFLVAPFLYCLLPYWPC